MSREEFLLREREPLAESKLRAYAVLLARRAAREPLAYITGEKEFWSLAFSVTPAVLIPRPETELLVELALEHARHQRRTMRIVDIGTGSGAVAIALAKHLHTATVWATDVSPAAITVAEVNAARHGVKGRVRFFEADLFPPEAEADRFDVIVSNPPYVASAELSILAPEVREWEPRPALDGGADGLDCYRRIIAAAAAHLAEGGAVFLEIGSDQAAAVNGLFSRAGGYRPASVWRDYAGLDRVIAAEKAAALG
jgi:release factor glutamine methyltransferase